MKDAETIKEIYKEYWRCMIDKDDYSAEHDEIQVKVNGCAAVMTGKSRVIAAVYGGGKKHWHLRGDFTLRKEGDQWKLTSSSASTY